MSDTDLAKRGEVNELRDRITRLETKQRYSQESLQSLAARVDSGFARISNQMAEMNNRKTMLLTISGGAGGGVAVGLFTLCKHYFGG